MRVIGTLIMESLYNAYDAVVSRYIKSGDSSGNYRPQIDVFYSFKNDILQLKVVDNGAGKKSHTPRQKSKINSNLKLFIGGNGVSLNKQMVENLRSIGHMGSARKLSAKKNSSATFTLDVDLNKAMRSVEGLYCKIENNNIRIGAFQRLKTFLYEKFLKR